MSAVALGDGGEPGRALRWAVLRWAALALLVAGAHAGAGWWLMGHAFAPPPPPEGVAGVTAELEPVSAPPTAEPKPLETAGPGTDSRVAEAPDAPSAPPPPAVEPPPPPAAEPPPPVEAAVAPPEPAPAAPEREPEPAPVPPPVPTPSDAVLAPPPPQPLPVKRVAPPKPPKPVPPRPDPRDLARQRARDARAEARQQAREEARMQASADARAQRRATRAQARTAREGGGAGRESAAPTPVPSSAALSTWRGDVQAHMNAYTPSSPNGAAGTVKVAFSVDRGGRIVSASVSSSSGDAELDRAALGAVRRASPVPAPPPGPVPGVIVPVHFR